MIQRLRKLIRTAFTPVPTFTVDDSLNPDFSFRKFWASCRPIYDARLQLGMLVFGTFCVILAIVVVL